MSMLPFGFLTELTATKLKEASSGGRANWKLQRELVFNSEIVGMIVVPESFETDFSSVPRLPFMYWLAGDTAHASAVVHDYLCRIWYPIGKITWRGASEVFGEAMRHEGVPKWRRWAMQQAVAGPDERFDA